MAGSRTEVPPGRAPVRNTPDAEVNGTLDGKEMVTSAPHKGAAFASVTTITNGTTATTQARTLRRMSASTGRPRLSRRLLGNLRNDGSVVGMLQLQLPNLAGDGVPAQTEPGGGVDAPSSHVLECRPDDGPLEFARKVVHQR